MADFFGVARFRSTSGLKGRLLCQQIVSQSALYCCSIVLEDGNIPTVMVCSPRMSLAYILLEDQSLLVPGKCSSVNRMMAAVSFEFSISMTRALIECDVRFCSQKLSNLIEHFHHITG